MDYRARYYDATINRFVQPDTIVPESVNKPSSTSASVSSSYFIPLTVSFTEIPDRVGITNRSRISFNSTTISESNGPQQPQLLNRYAYCSNNPLTYTDPTGHSVTLSVIAVSALIGGSSGAIGSIAAQMYQNNGTFSEKLAQIDWGDVGIASGVGAVAGALAPIAAVTTLGAVTLGSSAGVAQYGLTQWSNDEPITYPGLVISAGIGGFAGAIGGTYNPQPGGRLLAGSGYQFTQSEANAINSAMQIGNEILTNENLFRSASSTLVDNWDWIKQYEEWNK